MDNFFASDGGMAAKKITNLQLHVDNQKPESQQQVEFAKLTGIWCPKPARAWLESIMNEYPFTARDLAIAWKAGTIGWDADKDARKISTSWIEALYGYTVVIVLGVYFLLVAYPMVFIKTIDTKAALGALAFGLVYVAVAWMTSRFILRPRKIALRIKRIEEKRSICFKETIRAQ